MRKTKVLNIRKAGKGGDGKNWGVSTIISTSGDMKKFVHRSKPCSTCPYRKDSALGRFPPKAYTEAAEVSYDMAQKTFACHEAGVERATVCAGFLLTNAHNNMRVRIAQIDGRYTPDKVGNPDNVPLYASYKDMAVANGVDPDHPSLAKCRGDHE